MVCPSLNISDSPDLGTQWPHPQPQSQVEPQQRVFRLEVWYALVGQLLQRKQTTYALSVIKDIFSSQEEGMLILTLEFLACFLLCEHAVNIGTKNLRQTHYPTFRINQCYLLQ